MKDLFEIRLTSLGFSVLNGWGITFAEYEMLNGINEKISNSFWMSLFNFDFLCTLRDLINHISVI